VSTVSSLRPRQADDNGARLRKERLLSKRLRDQGDPVDGGDVIERLLPLARQLAAHCVHTANLVDSVRATGGLGTQVILKPGQTSGHRAG
jgi:hypothetical protein